MWIEIQRAGFANKGAHLMLLAALEQAGKAFPDAKFTVAPTPTAGDQPFEKFVKLGIYPKAWLWSFGFQVGDLARFLPLKIRQRYGIVLDRDIDVVLDAAGFAYGDQWHEKAIKELAICVKRWKRRGTKVILLPQALGPFQSPKMKKHIRQVVAGADLIFAREEESYSYLTEVVGSQSKLRIAPDFTNLIQGNLPEQYERLAGKICIVPNYRMVDKVSNQEALLYEPLLRKCIKYLISKGVAPFLLVHEEKDLELANSIASEELSVEIVTIDDPLVAKGILGCSVACIGSRYHALVGALSQGVPSLAFGWSHKYFQLLNDYGCSENLLDVSINEDNLYEKLDSIINLKSRKESVESLGKSAALMKNKSKLMWDDVIRLIEEKDVV